MSYILFLDLCTLIGPTVGGLTCNGVKWLSTSMGSEVDLPLPDSPATELLQTSLKSSVTLPESGVTSDCGSRALLSMRLGLGLGLGQGPVGGLLIDGSLAWPWLMAVLGVPGLGLGIGELTVTMDTGDEADACGGGGEQTTPGWTALWTRSIPFFCKS